MAFDTAFITRASKLPGKFTGADEDANLTKIAANFAQAVLTTDTRLANARAIADGNYGDFTVSGGVAVFDRTERVLVKLAGFDAGGLLGALTLDDIAEVANTIDWTDADGEPANMTASQLAAWGGPEMLLWFQANDPSAWAEPVRAADFTNSTLSTAYAAGQTVGGVVVAAGDRILLAGRTTQSQNGPYVVQASGAPVRAVDGDDALGIIASIYLVREGTYRGRMWQNTNTGTVVVGTTAITYTEFTTGAAGNVVKPVRVVAVSNGTLSTAFANGQTVNGVVLATGDPILLAGQTTGADNGPYIVNASGAPTRATDGNTDASLRGFSYLAYDGPTAGSVYRNTNTTAITVGTTALTYVLVNQGQARGADVAAAANVTLGSGSFFHITGTGGPITDIDFLNDFNGRTAIIYFEAAASVTHNGTSLITPNAEDFTATAGDMYLVISEGSDVIRMVTLKRARSILALGNKSGNFTIPIKAYHTAISVTLTGNGTITAVTGAPEGGPCGTIELFVTQDATGGRTLSESASELTSWGSDALTLVTTAGATTVLLLQSKPDGSFAIMNTGRSF